MRLHRTPEHWRPQGPTLRFVSFADEGRPRWAIAIGLVALALGLYLGFDTVKHLLRPHGYVPMRAFLVPLGFLAVALGCGYAAADRLLRGPDGALELDLQRRTMLILRRLGIEGAQPSDPKATSRPFVLELPFDGIEAIGVARQQVVTQYVFEHSGENAYRESKTLLRVIALPMGVVLLRDEVAHAVAMARATEIAKAIGVEARDLA